jgi:hypothetical protein
MLLRACGPQALSQRAQPAVQQLWPPGFLHSHVCTVHLLNQHGAASMQRGSHHPPLLLLPSCCWIVVAQTFAAAIALPTSVAVLMLLIWHIRMIHENKTTIEHAEVRECLQVC